MAQAFRCDSGNARRPPSSRPAQTSQALALPSARPGASHTKSSARPSRTPRAARAAPRSAAARAAGPRPGAAARDCLMAHLFQQGDAYRAYRPDYPDALYDAILQFAALPQRRLAVDVATGSGQARALPPPRPPPAALPCRRRCAAPWQAAPPRPSTRHRRPRRPSPRRRPRARWRRALTGWSPSTRARRSWRTRPRARPTSSSGAPPPPRPA
jgi:hypothetical protein